MYSICVRSSYGRICASYFCIVGSAVTRLTDGRNFTSMENMLLFLLLLYLTSISCLWIFFFWFTRTVKDCAPLWKDKKKQQKAGWQELRQNLCVIATRCHHLATAPPMESTFSACCIIDGNIQWTRRNKTFCSGHCFFFLLSLSSFFSASLFCFPVHIQYVSNLKMTCVCLTMCRKVVLNHRVPSDRYQTHTTLKQ